METILDDPIDRAVRILQLNLSDTISLVGNKAHFCDDADVEEIAKSWGENSSVTSVDLSLNRITDAGAVKLANALGAHTQGILKELVLDGNSIKSEGAVAVFQNLPNTLTRLDLSANLLRDDAVEELVQVLKQGKFGKNLSALILRDCPNLSNPALESLGLWLEDPNCRLSVLHISGNAFSDSSLVPFSRAIRANKTLIDLNLSNTHISDYSPLIDAIKENQELRAVQIGRGGMLPRETFPELEDLLRRNKRLYQQKQNEIGLLKSQHAAEIARLKESHEKKVSAMADEISALKAELDALKAKK
jgi:Ran GTPase-activating protein (RanGAP) involved in mRNA processing and transport